MGVSPLDQLPGLITISLGQGGAAPLLLSSRICAWTPGAEVRIGICGAGAVCRCGSGRNLLKDLGQWADEWDGIHYFYGSIVPNTHAETPRPARQPWEGGFQESSRRFLNSSLVPQGENVFFVITNLIVTPNQRQETCAEVCFGTRAGRWWKTPARGGGGEGCAHLQK